MCFKDKKENKIVSDKINIIILIFKYRMNFGLDFNVFLCIC